MSILVTLIHQNNSKRQNEGTITVQQVWWVFGDHFVMLRDDGDYEFQL